MTIPRETELRSISFYSPFNRMQLRTDSMPWTGNYDSEITSKYCMQQNYLHSYTVLLHRRHRTLSCAAHASECLSPWNCAYTHSRHLSWPNQTTILPHHPAVLVLGRHPVGDESSDSTYRRTQLSGSICTSSFWEQLIPVWILITQEGLSYPET